MDRVFLDANVLFAVAWGSPRLPRLWEAAKGGRCVLLASTHVIDEALRNLNTEEQRDRLHALLKAIDVVPEAPPALGCPVPLPPKDEPVLLAALAAGATHLLTGDARHFGPYLGRSIHGMLILRPAAYLSADRGPAAPSRPD